MNKFHCSACGREVTLLTEDGVQQYIPILERLDGRVYNIPFRCLVCDTIVFRWKPLHDLLYIYPLAEKRYKSSVLEIPTKYNKEYKGIGIVLAVGYGYWKDEGVFCKTQLLVGNKVLYNKDVPWSAKYDAPDGKTYSVVICGEQDVFAYE